MNRTNALDSHALAFISGPVVALLSLASCHELSSDVPFHLVPATRVNCAYPVVSVSKSCTGHGFPFGSVDFASIIRHTVTSRPRVDCSTAFSPWLVTQMPGFPELIYTPRFTPVSNRLEGVPLCCLSVVQAVLPLSKVIGTVL